MAPDPGTARFREDGEESTMTAELLSRRALNRATLERQLLLRRAKRPVLGAVEHLVGLQAQLPQNPYLGLWSRLDGFRPEELSALFLEREVVRIVLMRATLHLVSARDCLVLRPLAQPVLDRELARHPEYAPFLERADVEAVMTHARSLLAERPLTGRELRAALAERFPDDDPAALGYACRNLLPLVQVPPRGLWGRSAEVASTTVEAWLGRSLSESSSIEEMVLRYLAAFGPATVADVGAWSRLTGLGEVVDRLRPRLRTFRDERGRELLDLPDAPRPDPDTPAPPRFLPEYDNVLLSHADRSRFVSDDHRGRLVAAAGPVRGTVLLDGTVRAVWRTRADAESEGVTLVIDHVGPLSKRANAALTAEGRRLVRFLAPEAAVREVRLVLLD